MQRVSKQRKRLILKSARFLQHVFFPQTSPEEIERRAKFWADRSRYSSKPINGVWPIPKRLIFSKPSPGSQRQQRQIHIGSIMHELTHALNIGNHFALAATTEVYFEGLLEMHWRKKILHPMNQNYNDFLELYPNAEDWIRKRTIIGHFAGRIAEDFQKSGRKFGTHLGEYLGWIDYRLQKPFTGLAVLRNVLSGKSFQQAESDAEAGKLDNEISELRLLVQNELNKKE